MAYQYDHEYNVYIDDESGDVVDEYGTILGNVYDAVDDDDLDGLTEADVEALYTAGAETRAAELAELRAQVQALREDEAYRAGRQEVFGLAEDSLADDEQSEADFEEAMGVLADRLGRPISEREAEQIERFLPETYGLEDVERTAQALNIRSFSDNTAPDGGGRGQRSRYLSERFQELHEYDQELQRSGEDDPDEAGGLPAHLARLQQATSLDNGGE